MIVALFLSALRKGMEFRCDGVPAFRYYPGEAFGVATKPFSFRSGKWLLRGERYFLPGTSYKGVMVFFHGLGAGHTAYSQEIAYFAKHGYLVYAYDNTGCMTSEGRGIGCLSQSLLDQKAFFAFLDKEEEAKGLPRYAIGHSWGGFTAFGALQKEYGVKKVISISGFLSLSEALMEQRPFLRKMEGLLRASLRRGYGKYGDPNVLEWIAQSDAELLYVYGENDTIVPKDRNYDVLQRHFRNSPKVKLLLVNDLHHNPYWTLESSAYYVEIIQKHHLARVDFDNQFVIDETKLNKDDPLILKKMLRFLEENA